MATVLRHDGVNDYLTIPNAVSFDVGDTLEVKFRMLTNQTFAWISSGPAATNAYVRWNGSTLRARGAAATGPAVSAPNGIDLADGEFHIVQLIVGATTHKFNVDGFDTADLSGNVATPLFNTLSAFFNSYFDGDLEYLKVFNGGGDKFNWDANASLTGTGATKLTETVSANDADGVGFPTDGSQWIDTGGRGSIDVNATLGNIAFTSNNSTVSVSGVVDVQAALGNINYISNNTSIDLSGSIDVNALVGNISYVSNNADVDVVSGIVVQPVTGSISYSSINQDVSLQGTINVIGALSSISYASFSTSVRIGNQWTDMPKAVTNWSDSIKPNTIWTDK